MSSNNPQKIKQKILTQYTKYCNDKKFTPFRQVLEYLNSDSYYSFYEMRPNYLSGPSSWRARYLFSGEHKLDLSYAIDDTSAYIAPITTTTGKISLSNVSGNTSQFKVRVLFPSNYTIGDHTVQLMKLKNPMRQRLIATC